MTVVIATRDRRASLLRTLDRLRREAGDPPVVVVDNASSDGTPLAVARHAPWATVHVLRHNAGAAARNHGVRLAPTPFVAFCDDDSWWSAGSLPRAARTLAVHPALGLVAARVLVGDSVREDPVCAQMSRSPLRAAGCPGRPVLGFLACAAVVRRSAFLAVGGFAERFGIGGEEELLAIDLWDAGWQVAYLPDLLVRHHPDPRRGDGAARRRVQARNAVWSAWLRRPARRAIAATAAQLARGLRDGATLRGVAEAARHGGWVTRHRRVVGAGTEYRLRTLEAAARSR